MKLPSTFTSSRWLAITARMSSVGQRRLVGATVEQIHTVLGEGAAQVGGPDFGLGTGARQPAAGPVRS